MTQNYPRLTHNAAVLQSYNNEMVKCIEDLCSKRDDLKRQIQTDQEEKAKLHRELQKITSKLAKINEQLAQKMTSQNEFDRAISETQAAYSRVMENSQILLHTVHAATAKLKIQDPVNESGELPSRLSKSSGKKVTIRKEDV